MSPTASLTQTIGHTPLTRPKGIGANDATLLTHEIFYRGFRNRREIANWVGMMPTP